MRCRRVEVADLVARLLGAGHVRHARQLQTVLPFAYRVGANDAHLPSGRFNANGAWAILAAVAFNLTRAAGTLASKAHARARTGTIRTQLITVPARIATTARRLHLHLPERWPWQNAYTRLFEHTCGPPQTATT